MKLKAVHTATHPALLQARQGPNDGEAGSGPQDARDALLQALEAEAADPDA